MKASNPSKRAAGWDGDATGAVLPAEGILAALRDTLTALRSETIPAPAHRRAQELASCWHEVFQDIEKLEAAFLFQDELARALAAAPHSRTAAKRVPSLRRKAEQLRAEALGTFSSSVPTGQRRARSGRGRQAG